jgi:phenylalanyl-tRNA synthetase beta chain
VYVEAAFWWPKAIAGRSRRFNFSTDAGHRFERGVDPAQTVEHIERITQLIIDICGTPEAVCGPGRPARSTCPSRSRSPARGARRQGHWHAVTQAQCLACVLKRLGLPVTEGEGTLTVHATDLPF